MRRSVVVATAVTGLFLVLTTAAVARSTQVERSERTRQAHHEKMQDLVLCERGYEIASSFPSYASRNTASPEVRRALIEQADFLSSRQRQLTEYLDTRAREEAIRAGISPAMYDSLLVEYRHQAEFEVVQSFQAVDDPNIVLRRLNGLCHQYLNQQSPRQPR